MSLHGEDGEFLSITELPLTETPNDEREQNIPDEASHADSRGQEL